MNFLLNRNPLIQNVMNPFEKEIKTFHCRSSAQEEYSNEVHTGSEITFNDRAKKQLIGIYDPNLIEFEITNYSESTKHIRFQEGQLSKALLLSLGKLYHFEVISHKYDSSILTGTLHSKHYDYSGQCFGAIHEADDSTYLLIYARRGETLFEDNIIYVHGIWRLSRTVDLNQK